MPATESPLVAVLSTRAYVGGLDIASTTSLPMKKFWHILTALMIAAVFCASTVSGAAGSASSREGEAGTGGSWRVELTGDRYSLQAENAERFEILNEIARLSGAALGGGAALRGRVSVSVRGVAVEELLARLLDNTAFVFAFEPATGRYRMIDIWGFVSTRSKRKNDEISPNGDDFSSVGHSTSMAFRQAHVGQPVDAQGRLLYKPGEVIVQFKPGFSESRVAAVVDTVGGRLLSWSPGDRLATVSVPGDLPELEAVRRFYASGAVEIAERQALRYPFVKPNDPDYSSQWAPGMIGAETAWAFGQGDASAIIGVIDTGIDYNHPDIRANRFENSMEVNGVAGVDDDGNGYIDDLFGWDFADDDASPMDTSGHGTHVAGIIAAVGNNGIGVTGVAWHARLMALKVQKDGQTTFDITASNDAMSYALAMGAKIINCSYGGSAYNQIEKNRIANLGSQGILFVCAAGNGDPNGSDADVSPIYPAAYNLDNIISVGAGNAQDEMAAYSYYGDQSVDLLAPGGDGYSTGRIYATAPADSYGYKSGTSMAAPHVTGAAALLWSKTADLTMSGVKAAILGTVDKIPAAEGKTVTGGRLNAAHAMCFSAPQAGDIDCSSTVDLADLVIALQVMAAQTPDFCSPCIAAGTDPDGDGRIQQADALNILQRLAGVRE